MLYKAMQVKEIPIVFRGSVNGGTSPDPEDEYDYTIGSNKPYYACNFYVANDAKYPSLSDVTKIWVECDGIYYGEIVKHTSGPSSYGGSGGFGFPVDSGTYQGDFTDYPFLIAANSLGTYIVYYKTSGTTINLKIWFEDPTILNPEKKIFSAELTGNGQIKRFHARFACGENGTLHINPYVILNGNITVNLCDFAKEGENYISGDNEDFTFECYVPIETHAMLYVEAENVGEYASMLDVAIVVQYEDFIEEETIVGYEGINLRRIHR